MCWNKEVSLFTFIVICVVSYKLYERNLENDKLLAFFIISYGSMQFFEFIIWLGLEENIKNLNKLGSMLACILLYLHPLAIMCGIKYDKLYKSFKKSTSYTLLFIASFLFLLYGMYRIIYYSTTKNPEYKFLSYSDKNNHHLVWDFPNDYHIVLILSLLISVFIYQQNKLFWLCTMLYYFLPILFIYLTNDYGSKGKMSNGSYWCWYVAIFSFLLYFINPKIQNNK
jgi:hypothetical protein